MKRLRQYFTFLIKYGWITVLAILFNIFSGYFRSAGASYLQKITDALEAGILDGLATLIWLGGLCVFLGYLLRWFDSFTARYLCEKFALLTRFKLFDKLLNISFSEYESRSTGELLTVIRNDSVLAGEWIYAAFSRILNNVCLFIFAAWMMAKTNLEATLIIIAAVTFSAFINQIVLKRLQPHYLGSRKATGEMTRQLEKVFAGLSTIKTYNGKAFVVRDFGQKILAYCSCERRAVQLDTVRVAGVTLISKLCFYLPWLYLGILSLRGVLSVGEVVMFVYLIREIITPIEVVFRWMSRILKNLVGLDRVNTVLRLPTQERARVEKKTDPSTVFVNHLSFAYSNQKSVFSDISFLLRKGTLSRLSGASGSGKTTLMKVLLDLYSSDTVCYQLDTQSVPHLVGNISYSSLENSVFPFSIYENIALGSSKISVEDCIAILERLGFEEWIRSLPQGIHTAVLQEQLSGGQKQAISICRTLLADAPIVLLDEPFSALDQEKYHLMLKELCLQKKNKIILVTSHRNEGIWDQIISLEKVQK